MNTLIIKDVDLNRVNKLMMAVKDIAFIERRKGEEKNNPLRTNNAYNLDALIDLVEGAIVN